MAVLVSLGVLASACGTSAGANLARQACTHVDRSLQLYHEAEQTPDPSVAIQRRNQALSELRAALPIAAAATSANGQWVALETTISESARVDEGQLLVALRQECAVAQRPNPDQAGQPGAPPAPG